MEERKRPALDDHETLGPPQKKQAVTVNGINAKFDADMPWKDELDQWTKDSMWRQMREDRREKRELEQQIAEAKKRAEYHDDHLRIIDGWFSQLLDEVSILANGAPLNQSSDLLQFSSSLIPANSEEFQGHLNYRSEEIRNAIKQLYGRLPVATVEVQELQQRLSDVLTAEKAHIAALMSVTLERDQLSERLENASMRYLIAEKKLDRARSAQVAKLEAQAISASRGVANGSSTDLKNTGDGSGDTNGVVEDVAASAASETARKEALAVAQTQAEQLNKLAEENQKLTKDLTAAQIRLAGLTEDDYANSELFKTLKTQYSDLIKRINDLEAINIQLRSEAQHLQAERTAQREEFERDSQANLIEIESQLARTESDLARIRHVRDELVAELTVNKATQEQIRVSKEQIEDLASARESRITVLESELDRLRSRYVNADVAVDGEPPDSDELSSGTLHERLNRLQKEKSMLENELRSMEIAWKKASAAAGKKITEVTDFEDKIIKLSAEKAKADQKYFGAMKAKETRESEIKALRAQNAKSSEMVSQLKDAESSCRALLINMEKQLAEVKDALSSITGQYRVVQHTSTEYKTSAERLTTQLTEMKRILADKDGTVHTALQAQRQSEVEATELKTRLEETHKSVESWRKKALSSQSVEQESLRAIAYCQVCKKNLKDTVIKTCGHVLCKDCIEERIQSRSRKCPLCSRTFGKEDHMRVTL